MADAQHSYISLDKLSHFLLKVKDLLPTKTSDLDNDSNFAVDATYVHTDNNYTTSEKNKLENIEVGANNYALPTAGAATLGGVKIGTGLAIDANGILSADGVDTTVNNLANYYLKSETYTKAEVQSLIGDISGMQIAVPDGGSLPTSSISTNTIYLIPRNPSEEDNIYIEYLYVNGDWEIIGTTSVDLSAYWAKEDLVEATNSQVDALFTA